MANPLKDPEYLAGREEAKQARREGRRFEHPDWIGDFKEYSKAVGKVIIFIFSVGIVFNLLQGVKYAYSEAVTILHGYPLIQTLIISLIIFSMGYLFYLGKKRKQKIYGYCELIFAFASTIDVILNSIYNNSLNQDLWIKLIGLLYLTGRGFENLIKGIETEKALKNNSKVELHEDKSTAAKVGISKLDSNT